MRAQRLSKARRKEIARQAGAAKKNPVGRPKGSTSISKVVIAEAIDLYKSGQTLEQIGATFDVSRERVRQLLKKHGIHLS